MRRRMGAGVGPIGREGGLRKGTSDEGTELCMYGARGRGERGSELRREGATERGRGAIKGGPSQEGRWGGTDTSREVPWRTLANML